MMGKITGSEARLLSSAAPIGEVQSYVAHIRKLRSIVSLNAIRVTGAPYVRP